MGEEEDGGDIEETVLESEMSEYEGEGSVRGWEMMMLDGGC